MRLGNLVSIFRIFRSMRSRTPPTGSRLSFSCGCPPQLSSDPSLYSADISIGSMLHCASPPSRKWSNVGTAINGTRMTQIADRLPKKSSMADARMPQFYRRGMATGELAHWSSCGDLTCRSLNTTRKLVTQDAQVSKSSPT